MESNRKPSKYEWNTEQGRILQRRKSAYEKRVSKSEQKLNDDLKAAAANGMSYGRYKAYEMGI